MRFGTRAVAWMIVLFAATNVFTSSTVFAATGRGRTYYEKRGDVVWQRPTEQKLIALTFDDGPDPLYTPKILDLLKEYHAHCTFFVVGQRVIAHPELVKRMVKEGHEPANHTYSHPVLGRVSTPKLLGEVERTSVLIKNITGRKPVLFRPPGGYYDNPQMIAALRKEGYAVVLWAWHQDSRDWSNPGTKAIVNKVLKMPQGGDIVLFHDYGGDRSQTVKALNQILPDLQRRGFRFVTVSQLLKMSGERRN